jgi:capsular polysaccharide biosynthesis protein
MEEELDLRPYVGAIARRWGLVLSIVCILAAVACIVALSVPRPNRAQADLFIVPRNPAVSLDPRFADRDATMFTNQIAQRQALISLGTSAALEARVAERLGSEPGTLLSQVSVLAPNDIVSITVSAPTQEEATTLAEAWAAEYQALVGELYSGADAQIKQIDADLDEALQQFDGVQAELDTFYADGELVRAEQQVLRLEGLLEGGAEAQVSLYTNYLTRTQELSLILEDARSLQAQYEAGNAADLSAAVAALAVRARVAGGEQLPVQLNFDSAEAFAQGQSVSGDLERFVTVLEAERDRMIAEADALASDLAAGNTAAVGLPADARASYEEELAAAKGALARAEGQEQLLLQRRTQALTSLEVLQSRADELRIAQSQSQVSLRLVGVAPEEPRSLVASLLLSLVVATVAGLVIGVMIALALELLQRRRSSAATKAPPTPEAIGRTSASD